MEDTLRTTTLATLTLVFACAGCVAGSVGGTAADTTEALSTPWQATLHCGGDGVVVDVDSHERQVLQAVVRDRNAVAWLSSHPGDGGAGKPNDKGEIVIQGYTEHGVFSPGDFNGFSQLGYAVTDALLPEAHVRRDGSGLRVSLVSWRSGREVETANWYFADCH